MKSKKLYLCAFTLAAGLALVSCVGKHQVVIQKFLQEV